MEIRCFDELPSTQTYLIKALKSNKVSAPIAIVAKQQTHGVGSRDNRWEGGEGNLFFSLALSIEALPPDLALSSASIYFSHIMKKILKEYSSNVWLKWPNDLYQNESKIGGVITKKIDNILVCGMGINLQKNQNGFEALNLNIEPISLLEKYFLELRKSLTWKQVFSEYRIEFERNSKFYAHVDGVSKPLKNATLLEDGSLIIDNKRVYSLR